MSRSLPSPWRRLEHREGAPWLERGSLTDSDLTRQPVTCHQIGDRLSAQETINVGRGQSKRTRHTGSTDAGAVRRHNHLRQIGEWVDFAHFIFKDVEACSRQAAILKRPTQ